MSRIDCAFITFALNCFFAPGVLLPQSNVLTANYDNSRTNSNLKEKVLNKSNVNAASFGKIGSFPVDGQIYAQALYVAISGKGLRNIVYPATMHNSVYAIDADAPGSIAPLWQVNLGPSVPTGGCGFVGSYKKGPAPANLALKPESTFASSA